MIPENLHNMSRTSFVSKRDTLPILIFLIFNFSPAHAADPRSKSEGIFEPCVDCVVNSQNFGNSNMSHIHDVAIFSKDQNSFIDPREEMNRIANPALNAIGVISVTGQSTVPPRGVGIATVDAFKPGTQEGIGSGFLINECLVVTNHHVAYIARAKNEIKNVSIKFQAGSSGRPQNPFAFESKGQIVAAGPFQAKSDIKNDWAIIKLDQPIADPENPNDPRHLWRILPKFSTMKDAGRQSVSSASFYKDKDESNNGSQLWGQTQCKIWSKGSGENSGSWSTDCPGIPRVSGSPVFYTKKDSNNLNQTFAFGIMQSVRSLNTEELKPKDSNLNNMIPFSEAMTPEQLQKIIDSNPCKSTTRA